VATAGATDGLGLIPASESYIRMTDKMRGCLKYFSNYRLGAGNAREKTEKKHTPKQPQATTNPKKKKAKQLKKNQPTNPKRKKKKTFESAGKKSSLTLITVGKVFQKDYGKGLFYGGGGESAQRRSRFFNENLAVL